MSNLVGTGLNQAPTNSMLGGLAYQDPAHASIKDLDLKNLSQINSETADTAVDVFVYDTSKDSDGGAWRKRTQHTSWYNETLNTATRGSRREFPAVAVIVAETTKVTIYDGDDPDLPMWMVFTWSGAVDNLLGYNDRAKSAITAVNGYLITCSDPDAVHIARFVHDDGIRYTAINNVYTSDAIANRTNTTYRTKTTTALLVSSACNDVAATVLPNAPIDKVSGLPVPTIAVATDGGASIIKDDDINVVHLYTNDIYDKYTSIDFGDDGRVYYSPENTTVYYSATIPPVNLNQTAYNSANAQRVMFPSMDHGGFTYTNTTFPVRTLALNGAIGTKIIGGKAVASRDTSYVPYSHSSRQGLTLIDEGASNPTSSVTYISSSYNTGWMHGNIKGAFLSDTTVESLTANTNLASSGTQQGTARLTSETYTDGATSWQQVDNAGNDNGYVAIRFGGLTEGQSYQISLTVDANPSLDGGYNHKIEFTSAPTVYLNHWNGTGAATLQANFTADSGNNDLYFYTNGATVNVTNFNIRAVDDEDRSYSNIGLGVYGTLTKSAVATGAELVAYSGFSNSNFLKQPYNSGLAPGTDAYCVMAWVKTGTSGSDQYIYDRSSAATSTRDLLNIMSSGAAGSAANKLQWWHRDSSGNTTDVQATDLAIADNEWHHVVAVMNGQGYYVYVDGIKSSIGGGVIRNIDNANNPPMYVGIRHSETSPLTGSMALFRYSHLCPSDEQIKKFYEDEKRLFQENAKCTFYGSSDPVAALGYDEENDTLHVGTSAGRSDFQGLCRINNTTTAVTTAISASDELIAEQ